MNKSWESHEQVMNKSRLLGLEHAMSKPWTSDEPVMNQSCTNNEQVMSKLSTSWDS